LVITAVSVLALGLAACDGGSDESPPTVTTTTTAASPTEPETISATPSQPAVEAPDPAAYPGMYEQTEEGAKQAHRYFWALTVFGYQTGDVSKISGMYSANCGYCAAAVTDIKDLTDNGYYWSPASIVDDSLGSEVEDESSIVVSYRFRIGEHKEHDTETGDPFTESEKSYAAVGRMKWETDHWELDSVALAQ